MSFERQDHLVHGRWRDSKVLLHVGLRRRAPVDFAVVVNERQVLALPVGIRFLHRRLRLGGGLGGLPAVRKQLIEPVVGVGADTREQVAKIGEGLGAQAFTAGN
jgi:hypothetical protein